MAARRRPSWLYPSIFGSDFIATMATLPGLPQTDEPEPDALPVEPDDGTTLPGCPPEEVPSHEPVHPPRA